MCQCIDPWRQVTNPNGNVVLSKAYDPYGVSNLSSGVAASNYGFTGEYTEPTGDIYLRARHYSPSQGRFMTRDTWRGDVTAPMSFNRWNYTNGNPINYTDPTGNSICYEPLPYRCVNLLERINGWATWTQGIVRGGALPVESFAQLVDFSEFVFESSVREECEDRSIRDLMWALTIVFDDMDANRGSIWQQATGILGAAKSPYYVEGDLLPYLNNPIYDSRNNKKTNGLWCDPLNASHCTTDLWVHSLIGDWNEKYWDKTAGQVYHFWFFVAVTFFEGSTLAHIGDDVHDPLPVSTYDYAHSDPTEAPPPWDVTSLPDKNLTAQAINLGRQLAYAEENEKTLGWIPGLEFPRPDIATWIRTTLK